MRRVRFSRRYYELCVLWELRRALRSGDLWIDGSRRYANPQTYLIPTGQWAQIRTEVCQMVGIPEAGEHRLKALTAQLDSELVKFTQTVQANSRVRIEADQLILSPLEAESPSDTVKALQALVSKCLPLIDLTEFDD